MESSREGLRREAIQQHNGPMMQTQWSPVQCAHAQYSLHRIEPCAHCAILCGKCSPQFLAQYSVLHKCKLNRAPCNPLWELHCNWTTGNRTSGIWPLLNRLHQELHSVPLKGGHKRTGFRAIGRTCFLPDPTLPLCLRHISTSPSLR